MSEELKSCPFCGMSNGEHKDLCYLSLLSIKLRGKFSSERQLDEAWNTRASGWISVDERLPEVGVWVLVRHENDDHYICSGIRLKGKNRISTVDGVLDGLSETHWMPLPEPPK